MDIHSKTLDEIILLGREFHSLVNISKRGILASIIAFGILTAGFLVFYLDIKSAKADLASLNFLEERLSLVEKNTLIPNSNPSEPEYQVVKTIPVIITAYSSSPWETDDNPYVTAAGTWVREGIIANNLLPFGTKVKIPELYGEKIFVVEDRMSWKKGYYHIDIWFPSYWEAKNFGAKRTYIEVLEG